MIRQNLLDRGVKEIANHFRLLLIARLGVAAFIMALETGLIVYLKSSPFDGCMHSVRNTGIVFSAFGGDILSTLLFFALLVPLIIHSSTNKTQPRKKKNQENLLNNNWFLQQILEKPEEGIVILDEQNHRTFHNSAVERIFGISPGTFNDKTLRELIDENTFRNMQEGFSHLNPDEQRDFNIETITPNGEKRYISLITKALVDEKSEARGTIIILRDITDFRKIQKDLVEAYTYLRAIILNVDKRIWLKDINGKYLLSNPKFNIDANLEPDADIKGLTDWDIETPSDAERYRREDIEIIERKQPFHLEEMKIIKGNECWVETSKFPVYDESGRMIGICGFSGDISERKKQERIILRVAEAVASSGGDDFFASAAEHLSSGTGANQILIARLQSENSLIFHTLAFRKDNRLEENFTFSVKNTPFEKIVNSETALFSEWTERHLIQRFYFDRDTISAFAGIRLCDSKNAIIGMIVLFFNSKNFNPIFVESLIKIFSTRVAFELERTSRENQLAISEEKYRTLVENISDTIFRLNSQSKLVYVGENVQRIVGFEATEILGKSVLNYIHSQDVSSVLMAITGAFARLTGPVEFRMQQKTGGYVWVAATGQPFYEGGKLAGIQGILRSVHDRKLAQEALVQSQEQLRGLVDNSHDGIILINDKLAITEWNQAISRITGYDKSEVLGRNIAQVMSLFNVESSRSDDYVNSMNERLRLVLDTGESSWLNQIQYRSIMRRNGTIAQIEEVVYITSTSAGRYLCGIFRDVTQVKTFELENRKLRGAIEQSSTMVIITDPYGIIEYVNPAFSEITGYSADEVIGLNPCFMDAIEENGISAQSPWEMIFRNDTWRGELKSRKKNGDLFWESITVSAVKAATGGITNFVAIKEDITAKKNMEKDLLEAKEKAEEMSRVKSSFYANMSHELRTPMISILGYSSILKDEFREERINKIGTSIYKSGSRLLETLNLILELSRIEAQKMEIELSRFNVIDLASDIVRHFKQDAEQKHLVLTMNAKKGLTDIYSDQRIVKQVINNLLNNAIKYTPAGNVHVELEPEVKNERNLCTIKVIDTGIGIPEEKINLIFDEFRQVSEGFDRSFEGSGLGLTLTKRFVEKLNGEISVESRVNLGSKFIVRFPIDSISVVSKNYSF